jgi:hypothetical protein
MASSPFSQALPPDDYHGLERNHNAMIVTG